MIFWNLMDALARVLVYGVRDVVRWVGRTERRKDVIAFALVVLAIVVGCWL